MLQEKKTFRETMIPFFDRLDKVTNFCITIALMAVLLIVMIQIIGRLLRMPVPWTEEFSRYAFIWMMFIGIAVSMRKSEAARVTILIQRFPRIGKVISKYFYIGISILFFVFVIVTGCQLVWQQISMKEVGTAVLMPMWIIGISLPVSGILGILCTLGNLILDPEILEGSDSK